jgi:hypothetical protein
MAVTFLIGLHLVDADFERIELEAGPLSQWLFSALAEAD